jgi:predicted SnoaL-like aldol condensation-catalyzing enzyme
VNGIAETQRNRQIVSEIMKRVFVDRDVTVVEEHFSEHYTQHNPGRPNGRDAIPNLIANFGPDFIYEPEMIVTGDGLVMTRGRYAEWSPKPMVAVDIFRLVAGKVVEHWDIRQEEISVALIESGNSMFTVPSQVPDASLL